MPEKTPPEWAEKLRKIILLLEWQDKEIENLKSRLEHENPVIKHLDLFIAFVKAIQELKRSTKNGESYIFAPYKNYLDFVSANMDKTSQQKFKEFVCDFQLIDPCSFKGSGLYISDKEAGRIRVIRIRADVCKWILN